MAGDEPYEPLPPDQVPGRLAGAVQGVNGVPCPPVVVVDLDEPTRDVSRVVSAIRDAEVIAVGVTRTQLTPATRSLGEALTCTLVEQQHSSDRLCVAVPDAERAARRIVRSVAACPTAALSMRRLLETTSRLPVHQALRVESAVYSMLLAGDEFARWRASRDPRNVPEPESDVVLLERLDDTLQIRLNVPHRRNAYSRHVRDGLVEAFDLALADETISSVVLSGTGPSFCSGGDLDEFGSSTDVSAAHLIRIQRSAGLRAHALRERLEVRLHGACVGAGIEIPSFAGRVRASDDVVVALPELAMGLVPGAGGSVGITGRIGRWRTAWLHLTGERIGAETALDWGLIDGRS